MLSSLFVHSGQFDLRNLENVQVHLNNNIYYPNNRLNIFLAENKSTQIYNMAKYSREGNF